MRDFEFYKFLIDNSQELICFHEANGTYSYVSPSIKEIAGYSPGELFGKNPYDFFHPDDKEYIQNVGHDPSLEGRDKTFTEYRFLCKNGTYTWLQTLTRPIFNENKQIVNLLTTSREISHLVELRNELKTNEMLLQESSVLAKIGAWQLDLETHKPIFTKSTYRIFDVDESTTFELNDLLDFYPENEKERIQRLLSDAVKLGKPWDIVVKMYTGKKDEIWVRSIGKPEIKFGRATKLYGVLQDISSQIEAQNTLKKAVETLGKQKDYLEDFNHIVSHNLRSPVNNLEVLINQLDENNHDKENQVFIEHIKKVSHSLKGYLEELIDVVRNLQNQELVSEKIKLSNTVNNTRNVLNGDISRLNPKITTDFKAWDMIEYPKIYLDSILLNLMSNSLKYSSPSRKPEITIKSFTEDDKKGIIFKDNGIGIDLRKHGHQVFKINQTFHDHVNGKGLGLFMTKSQIEAMGGQIKVDSELDQGTEFKIIF